MSKKFSITITLNETKYGLGSILKVSCKYCLAKITSSTIGKGRTGHGSFEVNTKMALGMIDAGLRESHASSFVSNMYILTPNQRIKRNERKVGKPIEAVSDESCEKVLSLEKARSKTDADHTAKINVHYDMRWGKRRRAMNSKTGFGSLIGKETGKVVAFEARNTSCGTCNVPERKGKEAKSHDCRKNWYRSSKAMEHDVEVELLRKIRNRGASVSAIATDNDSSTIKRRRDEIYPNLQKHADVGHTTKNSNLKAHVDTISSRHQGVTQKVIVHFEKCFTCAVKQNEGKPADVKKTC